MVGFFLVFGIPIMTVRYGQRIFNFVNQKRTALIILKVLCVIGVVILIPIKLSFLMIATGLVIAVGMKHVSRIEAFLYVIFTICVSSFIPHWLHDANNRLTLSWAQSVQFCTVTIFIYFLMELDRITIKINPSSIRFFYPLFSSVFFIAAFYLSFNTSIGNELDSFYQWHHWGAYVGQAELIYNGIIPLKEIPLQYGLGPIGLLAIGCKWDCWISMYWVIGGVTLIFFILFFLIIRRLIRPQNCFNFSISSSVLFVTVYFWPPFQANLIPVNTFPSLSALRFMPGVLMLWALIELSRKINDSSPSGTTVKIIHILWVTCFVWSPEAGIQATILWVPFYLFAYPSREKSDSEWSNIAYKVLILLGVLTGGIVFFTLIFYLSYGNFPSLLEYLAIFRNLSHANAVTKINSNGPVWFSVICCLILLMSLIIQRSNIGISVDRKVALQNLWLIGLLCFANYTYFLSHPEDSVFHSLMPYFSLMLIAVANLDISWRFQLISKLLLATLLAWSTLISGWSGLYKSIHIDLSEPLVAFFYNKPATLVASFNRERNNPFAVNSRSRLDDLKSKNLNQTLSYIYDNYHEPVEVYDRWWLISSDQRFSPWTGYHGLQNVEFMKPHIRERYLSLSAQRLKKSGWVVLDKDFDTKGILSDYQKIYQQIEIKDFGYYVGIRFTPK